MNKQEQTHIAGSDCQNPMVYCGTYHKYNSGSIDGAWVDIASFQNGKDFMNWCATELHKDEADPELMFQDFQNFPEWFYSESMSVNSIDEILNWWKEETATREEESKDGLQIVDYNEGVSIAVVGDTYPVRKKLKEMGGHYRKHKEFGPCWVFSAKKREDLEKFIASGEKPSEEKKEPVAKPDKALLEEYLNEMRKVWPNDESMIEYFRKKTSRVIRLTNGGLMAFEKPDIQTRFCFGYGCQGMTDQEACEAASDAKSYDYFIHANIDGIDRSIKALSGELEDDYDYGYMKPYLYRKSYCSQKEELNEWSYQWINPWQVQNEPWRTKGMLDLALLDDDNRKIILEAKKAERAAFEKRLNAWWKRYGEKYIDTWTYWADE